MHLGYSTNADIQEPNSPKPQPAALTHSVHAAQTLPTLSNRPLCADSPPCMDSYRMLSLTARHQVYLNAAPCEPTAAVFYAAMLADLTLGGANSPHEAGRVADVWVYSRALMAGEVAARYFTQQYALDLTLGQRSLAQVSGSGNVFFARIESKVAYCVLLNPNQVALEFKSVAAKSDMPRAGAVRDAAAARGAAALQRGDVGAALRSEGAADHRVDRLGAAGATHSEKPRFYIVVGDYLFC